MAKINIKIKILLLLIFASAVLSPFLYAKLNIYYKYRRINRALDRSITDNTRVFSGKYSVYVKGLGKCRFFYFYNVNRKFPAASLIKVPIMAAAFYKVSKGELNLNSEFTLNKKDITPGSGILRYHKVPFKITLGELIKLMIIDSDNTAANKVIDILGFRYINNFFAGIGLKDTSLRRKMMDFALRRRGIENYTSSRDMAYVLEKIYRGKLVSRYYSRKMISLLKREKFNDRIPKYLPKGVAVAHKTGLERNVVSDVGIVFSKSCNYIICVMVSNFRNYRQAKDFIAKLSLIVYNTQVAMEK